MDFVIKVGTAEKQRGACMVVGVFESRKLTNSAKILDKASQGYIKNLLALRDMEGKAGTCRIETCARVPPRTHHHWQYERRWC